eukprot:14207642-Alexandrium_andersonii.AAC.1
MPAVAVPSPIILHRMNSTVPMGTVRTEVSACAALPWHTSGGAALRMQKCDCFASQTSARPEDRAAPEAYCVGS